MRSSDSEHSRRRVEFEGGRRRAEAADGLAAIRSTPRLMRPGLNPLAPEPGDARAQAPGIGGGGGNRTRVREHSTFGSTCLAASFHLTGSPPDGQGCETASLQVLTVTIEAIETAVLCESTPEVRTHKHMTVRGWLLLKQPERSCRRWQLMRCSRIYEEAASSACTLGFITHVEAMSPPYVVGEVYSTEPLNRQG